ncbi:glycosyltransferase [uncultured Dokdonia sp.]|uniref:glycosyltransferase n=1 Tax=uncultured Dokdonia sp. TaxID=575653 RepID=UPI00262CCA15|nr:glycosyltransferase [uncultured Dokdonia sp.]
MRKGVNPEKLKNEANHHYRHRIIMPVYIPNIEEEYYKQTVAVFKHSLKSLVETINPETTAITIIDNNSIAEVDAVIASYKDRIDKKVTYNENKGKVYAVLNEMRSCYEPFVTCTDADVLFMKGWEKAVFKIFKDHSKAGVVAPLPSPSHGLKYNTSLFLNTYFLGKMGYKDIVTQEDLNLYAEGITNNYMLKRSNARYDWNEKQYYLKGDQPAIVGSGHFVATYKSVLFDKKGAFPKMKFADGYEKNFIDVLSDVFGLYRLSTVDTFAYHMGNSLDHNIEKLEHRSGEKIRDSEFEGIKTNHSKSLIPYAFKETLFKIFKKIVLK